MRSLLLVLAVLLLPTTVLFSQIQNAEMTTYWQNTNETLIPEEGFPPPADIDASSYLGRIRLNDMRNFPVFEARYLYNQSHSGVDVKDMRLAGIYQLPFKWLTIKGIFVESNPDDATPTQELSGYLMATYNQLNIAAGLDYRETPVMADRLFSVRAKYKIDRFKVIAGVSSQPDDMERYSVGTIIDLPQQIILGGMMAFWEDETGFSVNIGRFNRRGDFEGLPSFALNHLEVPNTYKWTNFRIMWGTAGIHYVRPTFDNPVFSGMLDLDMALILKQLVSDNYRHFDSPLLFKRYDEYGKVALRANYIDVASGFRRFDANLSVTPNFSYGPLQSIRGYVSFDRIHNPVFGWQDNRYHLNLATYLLGKLYTGITISSDFDEYTNTVLEFRLQTTLK
jgi:hypothetical protein